MKNEMEKVIERIKALPSGCHLRTFNNLLNRYVDVRLDTNDLKTLASAYEAATAENARYDAMCRQAQTVIGTGEARIFLRDDKYITQRYVGFGEWDEDGSFDNVLDAYTALNPQQGEKE